MAKLFPENMNLNPNKIISGLFYFHDQAAFNHLQTTSYSRHKALDKLYTGLEDMRDSISELLLGYLAPVRIPTPPAVPVKKDLTDEQLVEDFCKFADDMYEYGEKMKWWALSNRAADLSDLGYKVKYLLTLK